MEKGDKQEKDLQNKEMNDIAVFLQERELELYQILRSKSYITGTDIYKEINARHDELLHIMQALKINALPYHAKENNQEKVLHSLALIYTESRRRNIKKQK